MCIRDSLAKTARDLAESINADGIIVITRSGYTANLVSNAKPFNVPIYAFTNDKRVHRQLSLVGSVLSFYQKSIVDNKNNMSKIANTLKKVFSKKKKLKFVLISGMFSEKHSCLLYTSPSPRDGLLSRMPSSA